MKARSVAASEYGALRHALARAAWMIVAALSVGCVIFSIPIEFARLEALCSDGCPLGLSGGFFAAFLVAVKLVLATVSFAVGAVIFWRRSDDRMALFAALVLVTLGVAVLAESPDALKEDPTAIDMAFLFVSYLHNTSIVLLFYLFPDGRFVPRWTRALAVAVVVLQAEEFILPDSLFPNIPGGVNSALVLGFLASIVYAQVFRYRRVSGPVQRRQTKWVVFGITATVAGTQGVEILLPPLSSQTLLAMAGYTAFYLSVLFIPLSIGIAVLRYRLFDIDIIINRTLVYGVLTACVVVLYALVVGGLGTLLQTPENFGVSLLAVGLVAVLFAPLRGRLQRGVNRLMYGDRDEPYAILSRLGQRLEATLAPGAVLPAVVRTVAEALKLPYAAIELDQEGALETVAAVGEPVEGSVRLPLVYGGQTVGRLVLGPRIGEDAFSRADTSLLEDLAHQIGVAAHAARLTDDLQRSRERLVTAREEERRRIRRDLHDGLGPALSSAMLKLGAARRMLPSGSPADDLLVEVRDDVRATVADVRRLVYDLRPPALDQLGLITAIRDYGERCGDSDEPDGEPGPSVTVEAPEALPPLPAAVEVAAYRIAHEALTNAARHARARSRRVRLALEGAPERPELVLEISDDGVGLPAELRAGVGFSSMRERAEELGGTLSVESPSGGGVRVLAKLPLKAAGDGLQASGKSIGPVAAARRRQTRNPGGETGESKTTTVHENEDVKHGA